MKTMLETELLEKLSKKGAASILFSIEHEENAEHLKFEENSCTTCVEEEPPAWHEAVLKEREEEWKNREVLSENFEKVFQELMAEVEIQK